MHFNHLTSIPIQENPILTNDYDTMARIGQHQGDSYIGRGAKQRSNDKKISDLIGAIDQGTSSTRFLVFENQTGHLIASSQMEIKRITPIEGWVEIDPISIMTSVHATMANVYDQLIAHYNLPVNGQEFVPGILSCIGICNQRESTVVWDSRTGQPLYNVIVWMDNRTKYIVDEMIDSIPGRDFNRYKDKTGLPMSTYFSAFKLKWLMDNVAEVKEALEEKRLLFGTVDTWILWNLTGGKHLTDVTNASRTFLMDIETLQWDKSLCKYFKVPMYILPEIKASADIYGSVQVGPFKGAAITGVIGDQSAALFGHNCLQMGQTKATFGTGCFIMQNIGPGPISGALNGVHRDAKRGLVTTVGYKLGDRPACYALEGSVKIAGAALTWLRDNIQLIQNYEECDILVNQTTHSAGVFFVPALGGLYSPYWDPNAAGLFIGLSQFTRREHLVRATFDSIAFQTNDILSLMRGVANGLMIDGGLCKSDNLCQILADITGYDIIRPSMCETSALGASMVAGYGAGLWSFESMMAHSYDPLNVSLSHPNQTHHYPHESLHYCDKLSHSVLQLSQSQTGSSQFRARTKSMTSNEAAARHRRNSIKQTRAALTAANQQHHRQHLKSANGVNDDAGGGKEGDRGGGGPGYADYDDSDSAASSGQLVASVAASAIESAASAIDNTKSQISPLEPLLESDDRNAQTTIERLQEEQGAMAAPPSSCYGSGDNFEQAISVSGASARGRVDSPLSQITDSATSSLTPCLDLNISGAEGGVVACDFLSQEANKNASSRESALNYQKSIELSSASQNQSTHTDAKIFPYNLNSFIKQRASTAKSSGINTKINKNNTEISYNLGNEIEPDEEDDDDDDLVHEFGGRDSYGEDGYDSSNASLASNLSDDDQRIDIDYDVESRPSMLATESQAGKQEMDLSDYDDKLCSNQQQAETFPRSIRHRATRRQRKTSGSIKQMDIFQSYISLDHRTDLVATWCRAVERSMQWTKVHHEEVKRIDYQRLSSLPISMYLFFSIGMIALSGILSATSTSSALIPQV